MLELACVFNLVSSGGRGIERKGFKERKGKKKNNKWGRTWACGTLSKAEGLKKDLVGDLSYPAAHARRRSQGE